MTTYTFGVRIRTASTHWDYIKRDYVHDVVLRCETSLGAQHLYYIVRGYALEKTPFEWIQDGVHHKFDWSQDSITVCKVRRREGRKVWISGETFSLTKRGL